MVVCLFAGKNYFLVPWGVISRTWRLLFGSWMIWVIQGSAGTNPGTPWGPDPDLIDFSLFWDLLGSHSCDILEAILWSWVHKLDLGLDSCSCERFCQQHRSPLGGWWNLYVPKTVQYWCSCDVLFIKQSSFGCPREGFLDYLWMVLGDLGVTFLWMLGGSKLRRNLEDPGSPQRWGNMPKRW